MSNKNRLFAYVIGSILVIAIIVSFFYRSTRPKTEWSSAETVPQVLTVSAPFGADTIVAANGRSLISYNYKTGTSTAISADNNNSDLEGVDQIYASSNQKYILFHLSSAQLGSYFDTQLSGQGIDSSQPSWWVYDLDSKTYHNLPSTVSSAKFANGNLYTLSTNGNSSTITSYSLPSLTQLVALRVPDTDQFFPLHDGFLLSIGEEGKVLETKDGVVSTEIFSKANILNITADGKTVLLTKTSEETTVLETYNVDTKVETAISSDATLQHPTWTADNNVIYSKNPDKTTPTYYLYDNASAKTSLLQFTASIFKKTQPTPSALFDKTTAIASDGSTTYLVGSGLHKLQRLDTSYDKNVTVGDNEVEVQYYNDQSAFIVSLDSGSTDQEKQAVYTQLRNDGYDPLLLDIRFTVFTPPTINGR